MGERTMRRMEVDTAPHHSKPKDRKDSQTNHDDLLTEFETKPTDEAEPLEICSPSESADLEPQEEPPEEPEEESTAVSKREIDDKAAECTPKKKKKRGAAKAGKTLKISLSNVTFNNSPLNISF